MIKKAVVLVSGGLDSATCLAMAIDQGYECYTLSFDYGQRHRSELQASEAVSSMLGAKAHKIIKLSIGELGSSALTDQNIAVPDHSNNNEIPITYVPARNTIFLSIALGWAEILGARDIFSGICSVDYSGYPDCRPAYLQAFQTMANLATKAGVENQPFQFHAPLLYLTKAETIKAGMTLGVDYAKTISCYQANEKGQACGRCDSCVLRKKGFNEASISDPTHYL